MTLPHALLNPQQWIQTLNKAASICPTEQPRSINRRYMPKAAPIAPGTKTARQTPPASRNYIDLDELFGPHSKTSLMQDLNLPDELLRSTAALLSTKAAAILGPLALQALGPGTPQVTGPNAEGPPPIPIMGPTGPSAGPTGQVPASAAGQIAPPMGTPGAPVPPDPSQAQPQAPQAPPPPNPMAPAPIPGGVKTGSHVAPVGDLPGQLPGAPAGQGQPGPNTGAGPMGAASQMPLGAQPAPLGAGQLGSGLPQQSNGQGAGNSNTAAGGLGMGLPKQPPPTLPPVMNASLPPVGQAPLPGTGAQPGGAMRNSPATNPINMYGPISMSGEVNGNAGFGVKNSPVGDSKMAGALKPFDGTMVHRMSDGGTRITSNLPPAEALASAYDLVKSADRDVFQILGDLFEEYLGPEPLLAGTSLMNKLSRQQPRVSASGEGGIPYIIRPHTENGIDALKLDRYAYKGRRADSIVPPRYPAGDNGVRTNTSAK